MDAFDGHELVGHLVFALADDAEGSHSLDRHQ